MFTPKTGSGTENAGSAAKFVKCIGVKNQSWGSIGPMLVLFGLSLHLHSHLLVDVVSYCS